ncbi:monocarboxylate transporter 9-like [Rhipicephalus sanguineus]|uniref:monocarboxylate transporter 9-like n=1 Tax=Rhipicephalus sanguineus TaxID=34632 RepID=UPI0020C327B3|nr:monocarboxylate transporter 9-like [Rhipicephalus sanguineus]
MAPPSTLPNASEIGPDGCRSWFIATLCFLVNLLFSSFFRCGGLFFTSMMSTYQATRAQAAMPLGAYCGFVNLSGLAAGALIYSFGMRISAALGGLLMSAGCLASAFATGIPFLVVSVGVVTGSGHGILLSCIIVTVNEYFDRRRGTALGINMAGAPAASFIFPKVFDYCLAEYGLHGTFALVGALLLNIGPISLFFRKPPWIQEERPKIYKVSRRGSSDANDQQRKEAADHSGCIATTLQPLLGRSDDRDDSVRDNDNILFAATRRSTIIRLSRAGSPVFYPSAQDPPHSTQESTGAVDNIVGDYHNVFSKISA